MKLLHAKKKRKELSLGTLSVFVLLCSGCQSIVTSGPRCINQNAECRSIEVNAGYNETRWTTLEATNVPANSIEYEWIESEPSEYEPAQIERTSHQEPKSELLSDAPKDNDELEQEAPELIKRDYSDRVHKQTYEDLVVEYL